MDGFVVSRCQSVFIWWALFCGESYYGAAGVMGTVMNLVVIVAILVILLMFIVVFMVGMMVVLGLMGDGDGVVMEIVAILVCMVMIVMGMVETWFDGADIGAVVIDLGKVVEMCQK